MEKAWPGLRLTVYIATKLNRSHLTPGQVSYLLPCLGRTDEAVRQPKVRCTGHRARS